MFHGEGIGNAVRRTAAIRSTRNRFRIEIGSESKSVPNRNRRAVRASNRASKPGFETLIVTKNGWAAFAAGTEATEEPVLVTIELTSENLCNFTSDLQRSFGCWDLNRYPAGDFEEPVQVETCVSHNEAAMTDEESPSSRWCPAVA